MGNKQVNNYLNKQMDEQVKVDTQSNLIKDLAHLN